MTFIIGLTGSIGMGKSATAQMFRDLGIAVYDADAAVHELYSGAAAPLVEAAFPGTTQAGSIDRQKLGAIVLGNPEALKQLEAIVHPLLRDVQLAFLRDALKRQAPAVVLDVPLLFETGGERRCDAVVVVSAAPEIQRARVLARPGMTAEKFEMIHVKQLPDAQKRARAHFIVDTGRGFAAARAQVGDIVRAVAGRQGRAIRQTLRAADGDAR